MSKKIAKLEKFKHGGEISSEKLNLLVDTINSIISSYEDIEDIKKTSSENLTTVSNLTGKINDELNNVPEVKELLSNLLLYRDTVDWIDVNEINSDNVESAVEAIANSEIEGVQSAERLTIIRGTTDEINLDTPALKDKQLLLAVDPYRHVGTTNNPLAVLYLDTKIKTATGYELRRIPITANGTVSLASSGIRPEFVTVGDEVRLQFINIETTEVVSTSKDLVGPRGPQGVQGPAGDEGPQGIAGLTPYIGDNNHWWVGTTDTGVSAVGPTGASGRDLNVSISFSEDMFGRGASTEYTGQKYMGLKFYPKGSTADELDQIPVKWVRITGDTLYPVYNKATGELSFEINPKESFKPVVIKGDQGPQGPKGDAPELRFLKNSNSEVLIKPIESRSDPTSGIYYYDASLFKGDKGDAPEVIIGTVKSLGAGETPKVTNVSTDPGKIILNFELPIGFKGDTPTIGFNAEVTTDSQPSVIPKYNSNSTYDQEFTIRIPKGKDGINGKDGAYIVKALIEESTGVLNLHLSDGSLISAGKVTGNTGPQGPKGADGINGKDGKTFTIKGRFNTKQELPSTGEPGDAYFVGTTQPYTIYYWNTLLEGGAWEDAGPLQGEPGPLMKLSVGTVTPLDPTAYPQVEIIVNEDKESATINFGIPRGNKGDPGTNGTNGKDGADGADGADGRGIDSVAFRNSNGEVDTYQMNFTDGTSFTYEVINGVTHKVNYNSDSDFALLSPQERPVVELVQDKEDVSGTILHNFRFKLPEATRIIKANRNPTTSDDFKVGHYWLNMTSGELFYNDYKSGSTDTAHGEWDLENSILLKGKDGNSIRYGQTDPSTGDGAEGNLNDLYLDTVKGRLYKKTDTSIRSWTDLGISLIGKDGEAPEIGSNGHWIINGVDTGKFARGNSIQTYEQLPSGEALKHFIVGDVIIVKGVLYTYDTSITPDPWKEGVSLNGRGIKDITKVSTENLIDTYRINFDDNNHSIFTITNGKDAIAPQFSTPTIKILEEENAKASIERNAREVTGGGIIYDLIFNIPRGPKGDPGKDFSMSIKATVTSTESIDTVNAQLGDAYIVAPNGEDGDQILYVCINPEETTFSKQFYRSGNIKGTQGKTPEFEVSAIVEPLEPGTKGTAKLTKWSGDTLGYTLKLELPKGEKGDKLLFSDLTEEDKKELVGPVPDLSNTKIEILDENKDAVFDISTQAIDGGSPSKPRVLLKMPRGYRGYHFTPTVDYEGNLSWTNNGSLPNPATVNIKGPQGDHFVPAVNSDGTLSWTRQVYSNSGVPSAVNIKGPQGDHFVPTVDSSGNLTWTRQAYSNNDVPSAVNIKGPPGSPGVTFTWDATTATLDIKAV